MEKRTPAPAENATCALATQQSPGLLENINVHNATRTADAAQSHDVMDAVDNINLLLGLEGLDGVDRPEGDTAAWTVDRIPLVDLELRYDQRPVFFNDVLPIELEGMVRALRLLFF